MVSRDDGTATGPTADASNYIIRTEYVPKDMDWLDMMPEEIPESQYHERIPSLQRKLKILPTRRFRTHRTRNR